MKPIKVIFWNCPQQNVHERQNMCGYYSVYNLISMQEALLTNAVPDFNSKDFIEAKINPKHENDLDAEEVNNFYDTISRGNGDGDDDGDGKLVTLKAAIPAQNNVDYFQYFIQLCGLKKTLHTVDVADVADDSSMGKAELLISKYGIKEIIPTVLCYSAPDSLLIPEIKMAFTACTMKNKEWLKTYTSAFTTNSLHDVIKELNAGKAYGFISFFPPKDGPLGHWQSIVLYLENSGSIVLQIADSLTHLPLNEEDVLAKISPAVWKLCAALQHYPIMFGSVIRDFVLPRKTPPLRTKLGVNLQPVTTYFSTVLPSAEQAFSISFLNIFQRVMLAEITIANNSLKPFKGQEGPLLDTWRDILRFLPYTMKVVQEVVQEEEKIVRTAAEPPSFLRSLSGGLKRPRITGGAGRALTPPAVVSGSPLRGAGRELKASGGADRAEIFPEDDQVAAVQAFGSDEYPESQRRGDDPEDKKTAHATLNASQIDLQIPGSRPDESYTRNVSKSTGIAFMEATSTAPAGSPLTFLGNSQVSHPSILSTNFVGFSTGSTRAQSTRRRLSEIQSPRSNTTSESRDFAISQSTEVPMAALSQSLKVASPRRFSTVGRPTNAASTSQPLTTMDFSGISPIVDNPPRTSTPSSLEGSGDRLPSTRSIQTGSSFGATLSTSRASLKHSRESSGLVSLSESTSDTPETLLRTPNSRYNHWTQLMGYKNGVTDVPLDYRTKLSAKYEADVEKFYRMPVDDLLKEIAKSEGKTIEIDDFDKLKKKWNEASTSAINDYLLQTTVHMQERVG